MRQLDVDKVLNKLSQLPPALADRVLGKLPRREGELAPMQAAGPNQETPTAGEVPLDALLSRLESVSALEAEWNQRGLVLCRERVEGKGEDACLAVESEGRRLLGVFDGCGGSGAKVYEVFGGHTGAWVASRAASLATREWFMDSGDGGDGGDLSDFIRRALEDCKARDKGSQLLMGSLSREFPTTVAAFSLRGGNADFRWCGDSRCYLLDGNGLHQVTLDDADIIDAMRNLREDAPMTNVVCASRPFVIHARRLRLKKPALVFAATDGCYGYLNSPMAFEELLLETMSRADNYEGWRRRLDARLREISGDDYTLAAWPYGYKSYKAMKRALGKRLALLRKRYPQANATEEALANQWREYRRDYEALLSPDGEHDERG